MHIIRSLVNLIDLAAAIWTIGRQRIHYICPKANIHRTWFYLMEQ